MIVDLQGVGNILTDPQIHCLDRNRFGKGNLGYQGIMMFFNTHHCNEHCQKLGLLNPRLTESIPSNFKLIAELSKEEMSMPENTPVHKLCDLCRDPFETTFKHYVTQRNQCFELWCKPCTKKRDQTVRPGTCKICNKVFKSSGYWFLRKRADFPVLCSMCRLDDRDRMRKELAYGYVNPIDYGRGLMATTTKRQEAFTKIISDKERNFPTLPQ